MSMYEEKCVLAVPTPRSCPLEMLMWLFITNHHHVSLQELPAIKPDPILDLGRQYRADTSIKKVDLGEIL
jgi:hypothetical protein